MASQSKAAKIVQEVVLHVAPNVKARGNGSASRPFGAISAALAATDPYRKEGRLQRPVRIVLHDGLYFLDAPLVLSDHHSGGLVFSRDRNCVIQEHLLTIAAAPGAHPRISGGRQINGFREQMHGSLRVWCADLPDVKSGKWNFRQLWVNAERRARPRLPKSGFYRIERAPGLTAKTDWCKGQKRFVALPGEFQNWKNLHDVEVVALTLWIESRMGAVSFNPRNRMVTCDRPSFYRLADDTQTGDQKGTEYYVENIAEALDTPGHWYLDRPAGKLYYAPLPDETLQNVEVIAPRLSQLLIVKGRPSKSPDATAVVPANPRKTQLAQQPYYMPSLATLRKPGEYVGAAENIVIEGIHFCHTEWRYPEGLSGSAQAAWDVPAAVEMRFANRCTFRNCTFRNLGSYALGLYDGCTRNTIEYSDFHDLGGGGLKIWHGCRGNTLSDCTISEAGRVFHSAVGVLIGRSGGNQIIHNHIHHLYYTGISVGWNWGYAATDGFGNIIEHNHIHDLGSGCLSDMGGIYLLGVAPGTRVRNNTIHDITCRRYGGWAIYPDEGSSDLLIENNLSYNCNVAPFHQHYGQGNVVRNNIFAFGKKEQLAISRIESGLSTIFERNIILMREGKIFGTARDQITELPAPFWPKGLAILRQNLYCHLAGGDMDFGGMTFKEWTARGEDKGSIVADPKFTDPENGDFTLAADSPAARIGFIPFDFRNVGPRSR